MEGSKFKDPMGRWITTGLFKELVRNEERDYSLYTLEEAKQLYLSCDDITGYQFAITYLGGWKHWVTMLSSSTLEPIFKEWEEELEVRLRSEAIKKISNFASTDKGYQAAKYLADKGWRIRDAGKPSKEEVERETRVQGKMYEEFNNVVGINKRK